MLTAGQARKISEESANKNRDEIKEKAKRCVRGILVGIKKDAEQGYCRHDVDLNYYPVNIRMPIVYMLEDLGYKVKRQHWLENSLYSISW